jgi:hypothetical protein
VLAGAMLTASLRPQPEASMPGRQLPQAKTRLVAGVRVPLCNNAIPAARSGSFGVVSRAGSGLVLQQRDCKGGGSVHRVVQK